MSRPTVILADADEQYIATLEMKFLEELYEKVDLVVITDPAYFQTFFSTPQKAEILVVSEGLYDSSLKRHDINHIFLLAEQPAGGTTEDLAVDKIYKYTSVKEIFNEIVGKGGSIFSDENWGKRETEVILFYSAAGGAGTTSLALAFADSVSRNYKRVLYLSVGSVPSFQCCLKGQAFLPAEACRIFRDNTARIYQDMKPYLRNEGFTYLPPFHATPDSLGFKRVSYLNFLDAAKGSKDFDYIVVDAESGIDAFRAALIQKASKVVIVTQQDTLSIAKTEFMLRNIDCRDNEKFVFVCNKYNRSSEAVQSSQYLVSCYVDDLDGKCSIAELEKTDGVQRLVYQFV
jgi:hypothetical protein